AGVQLILPRVPEGRVAQIVSQRDRLGQVFMQTQVAGQRARYLGHFYAVRQAGAEQVALVVDEDLRLVFKQAECIAMNDAITVALELIAACWRGLDMPTPARLFGMT